MDAQNVNKLRTEISWLSDRLIRQHAIVVMDLKNSMDYAFVLKIVIALVFEIVPALLRVIDSTALETGNV